ncbi:alpha-L-rhamnosidase-related protein [Poritiphilus flavus]|nr:alpha-L-rhamnosidase C-terminal domain-containing protein [Poritiphilus flavus]
MLTFMLLWLCVNQQGNRQKKLAPNTSTSWNAKWIAPAVLKDTANVWSCYRKEFQISTVVDTVMAKISADSKYWLWINGEMVVFEGGLKRGSTPNDSYFDKIDITRHLKKGKNVIAVLAWYFGKDGFSHKNSGQPAFLMQMDGGNIHLVTDGLWKAWQHPAFGNTHKPFPNYRLPESNIRFDARKGSLDFIHPEFFVDTMANAMVLGKPPASPWGKLIERPIPQWKDYGLKSYENDMEFPLVSAGDTLKMQLPYNAQITPYLEVESEAGKSVDIRADNYLGGGVPNVRAEYITKSGSQSYESFGWMNGHAVHYAIPKGVKILSLKYRETGYNTEFTGSFQCDDDFYNQLWQKSLRTLYLTMRDTYMDCPDRERAQWWGDVVLESGEAFYALSPSSHLLAKKGIHELMHWQRNDSTIYSPVPSGNWHNELPTQMLSSIGTYGFWNYYWHTGDTATIAKVYDKVGKYLALWKLEEDGTVQIRKGGWTWGDWGENKDMPLLFNTQYYIALDSYKRMAGLLGDTATADSLNTMMAQFKKDFNSIYWNGTAYRSKAYAGETDDRSQGLAVVSGLADPDKYTAILKILEEERHASPYMEKYVLEALFRMGYPEVALKRMKQRFSKMVNHPTITTMWEGWGIGDEGYGGGTINHAWSGGGLTLLSQYAAGISPTSAGWETFQIKPQPGFLKYISAVVPTVKGDIKLELKNGEDYQLNFEVPKGTRALVYVPTTYENIAINDEYSSPKKEEKGFKIFELASGNYAILGKTKTPEKRK